MDNPEKIGLRNSKMLIFKPENALKQKIITKNKLIGLCTIVYEP